MREVILRNLAECKRCKDVIESKSVHDYVSCSCGAIAVDGGKEYLRRSYDAATSIIERSQVEYHPIATWLANRLNSRIIAAFTRWLSNAADIAARDRMTDEIANALKFEATHHIMGGLNDVPEFAALSFEVRDKIRKTIQRELTGEYK